MKLSTNLLVGLLFIVPFGASATINERHISFHDPYISGEHVRLLQTILNDDPRTRLSTEGVGAPGNETTYLGPLTRDALKRFQELHRNEILAPLHLTQGTGILGKRTLAVLEQLRAERLSTTLVSPPITDLLAHEHHPGEGDGLHAHWYNTSVLLTVPEDMWVTSIVPEVRDIPREILHHAMVFRMGEPNPVCPNIENSARELFAVSANSVGESIAFLDPYALHLKKGDQLYMEVMVHNPFPPLGPGKFVKNGTFAIRLSGVIDTPSDKQFTPIEFVRIKLDDNPCEFPLSYVAFKVPANTPEFVKRDDFFGVGTSTSSGTFVMPHDATVIGIGANIWPMKGGQAMRMLINNEQRAEILPVQNDPKTPWSWSLPLLDNIIILVKKGDIVSAEAVYANPNPHVIPDASGMLGFYYARQ